MLVFGGVFLKIGVLVFKGTPANTEQDPFLGGLEKPPFLWGTRMSLATWSFVLCLSLCFQGSSTKNTKNPGVSCLHMPQKVPVAFSFLLFYGKFLGQVTPHRFLFFGGNFSPTRGNIREFPVEFSVPSVVVVFIFSFFFPNFFTPQTWTIPTVTQSANG